MYKALANLSQLTAGRQKAMDKLALYKWIRRQFNCAYTVSDANPVALCGEYAHHFA